MDDAEYLMKGGQSWALKLFAPAEGAHSYYQTPIQILYKATVTKVGI